MVNWLNPYEDRKGEWLKGNLHTHTSPASGCAKVPVERVLELYAERGYDFVALSDHMKLTEATHPGLVLIPGIEWNSDQGEHTGVYSTDRSIIEKALDIHNQEDLLDKLAGTGALVILNHPNWQLRPHYRREELEAKSNYHGIEIYNGVIERLAGYAISTDKWDYLLTQEHRALGFASDDSHLESDIGMASIVVRTPERTPGAILRAIQSGNFYCSSGVTIRDIRREGDIIRVEAEGAEQIEVRSHGGRRIESIQGDSMSYDLSQCGYTYARFTLYGHGSTMAWTQPFFRE